jgi:chromosome segregation ATPase
MVKDDVLFELDDIKKELQEMEEQIKQIMQDQRIIKNETQALLAEENRVEQKLTKMKFSDITAWKGSIWEHCSSKETKTGQLTISYWCKQLDAPCRFEDCPLNHY